MTPLPLFEELDNIGGDVLGIGGATGLDSTTPGAIVVLVKTAPGAGKLVYYFGGCITSTCAASAVSIPIVGEPITMYTFSIGGLGPGPIQHAWVAANVNGDYQLQLYNLANKTHVTSLDIELNNWVPLAIKAAFPPAKLNIKTVPETPIVGTSQAFVHVLVKEP